MTALHVARVQRAGLFSIKLTNEYYESKKVIA